jgi:hypothetical protein
MENQDPEKNPYVLRMEEYQGLLDKYIDESKKLQNNELMFAFAHTNSTQMAQDMKE